MGFFLLIGNATYVSSVVLADYTSEVNVVRQRSVNNQNSLVRLAITEMNFHFVQRKDSLLDIKLNA